MNIATKLGLKSSEGFSLFVKIADKGKITYIKTKHLDKSP